MSGAALSAIILAGGHVDLSDRIMANTTVVGSPALAAETAIASVTVKGAVSTALGVIVICKASFTIGTSGVSYQLRTYHGTASGTKLDDSGAVTAVATDLYSTTVVAFDPSPKLPNQVYTTTLTIASGAAASTVSAVTIVAIAV